MINKIHIIQNYGADSSFFQCPSLKITFVKNVRVVSKTQQNIQNEHQGLIYINLVIFPYTN